MPRARFLLGLGALALVATCAVVLRSLGAPPVPEDGGPVARAAAAAPSASAPAVLQPSGASLGPAAEARGVEPRRIAVEELAALDTEPIGGRVAALLGGRPIAGAAVTLSLGDVVETVVTGEDGAFQLAWPVGWSARFAVEHDAYQDLREPEDVPRDGRVILLAQSGGIEGRVRSLSGAEVAGVPVSLWPYRGNTWRGSPLSEIETDDEGRFAFPDLEPGRYAVGAFGAGSPLSFESGVVVEAGRRSQVLLELAPGHTLHGRVVVGDGEPVEGARVDLWPEVQGTGDDIERRVTQRTLTDAAGAFTATGLGQGTLDLRLRSPWGAQLRREVGLTAWNEGDVREFRFPTPARIAGRVLGPDESPVAGGVVGLVLREESDEVPLSEFHAALADPTSSAFRGVQATIAAPDGSFEFPRVASRSSIWLIAFPPEWADEEAAEVYPHTQLLRDVEEGQDRADVELRLLGAQPIRGRVLLEDGQAATGAEITLQNQVAGEWRHIAEAYADGNGAFEFPAVRTLRARLVVELEGHRRAVHELDRLTEAQEDIVITLRSDVVVRGRVVDPEGRSVGWVAVGLERGRRSERWTRADEFGEFTIDRLERGTWRVEVSASGWTRNDATPETVEVPTEETLVVVLDPVPTRIPVTVAGEVVDAETGGPVPRLRIRGIRTGTVDLDGTRFFIDGLDPGGARIIGRSEGYEDADFGAREFVGGGHYELGRKEVWRAAPVEVRVVRQGGEPLERARVTLEPVDFADGGTGPEHGSTRLRWDDDRRHYENERVARRAWDLVVKLDGYQTSRQRIEVGEEGLELRVRLDPKPDGGGESD